MKTCVFITVGVVVGLSRSRFPDEKGCCLSSKTREKNICRGRMIRLSTEMARVAEVDCGNCVMKRESDRSRPEVDQKCLNHARAQSVNLKVGLVLTERSAISGNENAKELE